MLGPPLPRSIEPFKLVDQRVNIAGEIALSQFARLDETLLEKKGSLQLDLRFNRDEERIPIALGRLSGTITLRCERCLKPVDIVIDSAISLGLVLTDEQASGLPRYYDPLIVEDGEIDLWSLVEEELILALPIVVLHETESCFVVKESVGDQADVPATKPRNAFAELGKLKFK